MPDDMTVAGLQTWYDSQMIAADGRSGFLTRREAEDAIRARMPATDAWQREQMAKGLEAFAKQKRSLMGQPGCSDAAISYSAKSAERYAQQLRNGEAV